MFARRARWDLSPNPLAIALDAARRAGRPIVDLTESNPTRCGFEYPAARILGALADPRSLVYEPSPFGLPGAREAVGAWYAARGLAVDPARIVLTASTSEAYGYLIKLRCDADDDVLVPRPSYPLLDYLTGLECVGMRPYDLAFDGDWHVDLGRLPAAPGPRSRALVVISPANPTGNVLKTDERDAIERLCSARDMAVIADEVFGEYVAPDRLAPSRSAVAPAPMRSALDGAGVLTFALGGLSKLAALPQLKLAWIAVAGPDRQVDDALGRLEVIADTYLSVGTPVQVGLPALLSGSDGVRDQIRRRVAGNRSWLAGSCAPGGPVRLLPSDGGWYAVLDVPRTRSDEAWVTGLVADEGVLVHPGYFFEMPREGTLVVSLLPEPETFRDGAGRMLARLAAER
jgi:aspartate/methionine/tyrosine aminotransferase